MNRRGFERHEIALSGVAHPEGGRSWLCTIQDFCQSGMLLLPAGDTRTLASIGVELFPADLISVHYRLPTSSGEQFFQARGRVARVLESGLGVGIVFEQGLPDRQFEVLLEYVRGGARSQPQPTVDEASDGSGLALDGDGGKPIVGQAAKRVLVAENVVDEKPDDRNTTGLPDDWLAKRRLSEEAAARLRSGLEGTIVAALETIFAEFLRSAGVEYMATGWADRGLLVPEYVEATRLVTEDRQAISERMVERIIAELREPRPLEEILAERQGREGQQGWALSIVDNIAFEDWLVTVEMITKLELHYRETLLELRTRFGLLEPDWAHSQAIPVGPAMIGWAFAKTFRDFKFRREPWRDAHRYFQRTLVGHLGGLYEQLIAELDQSGLLPTASEISQALAPKLIVREVARRRRMPAAMPGVYVGAVDGFATADGAMQQQAPGGAMRVIQDLVSLRPQTASGDWDPREGAVVSAAELRSVLQELVGGREDGAAAPVHERLVAALRARNGQARLRPTPELEAMNVLGEMVNALESDRYLSDAARQWIRKLEVTLHKLVVRDGQVFSKVDDDEDPHGAILLVNQLARLGGGAEPRSAIDPEVERRVDSVVARVVDQFDQNPEVISAAVEELFPLIDKQDRVYLTNLERTRDTSEGRATLFRAQRAVVAALEPRLADKDIPELALQLLTPPWRNLLVNTYLRRGPDSPEWQESLELFDQVLGLLAGIIRPGMAGYNDPEVILGRIADGLERISFDPVLRASLLTALGEALVGDKEGNRVLVKWTHVTADGVSRALNLEESVRTARALEAPAAANASEIALARWQDAVARASRLGQGSWVAAADSTGRPQALSVAFAGEGDQAYVFVNRKGVRVRHCSLQQLVEDLYEGRLEPLEDIAEPLTERASQRMLENVHQELAHSAMHDAVTGLANRRAFERSLGVLLEQVGGRDANALLHIDLDHFSRINRLSGHDVGDVLLGEVANELRKVCAGSALEIARIGGDEFTILLQDTSREAALGIAERILDAIRAMRFEPDDQQITLTASIGVDLFGADKPTVAEALARAMEACNAAKRAGRDRIVLNEASQPVQAEQEGTLLERLERAISEDALQLYFQRIEPLARGGNQRPDMLEILLSVDAAVDPELSVAEFIWAAETYQRSSEVDRWVITRVLDQLARWPDATADFGVFMINLCGSSLAEEDFADFMLAELDRSRVSPGRICFEIKEAAALANLEQTRSFMAKMRALGCKISLDDFGSDLKFYSKVRSLPFDFFKISSYFVRALTGGAEDQALFRSINEIGHYLGKETIALGVESGAIMERVRELGVDYVQGWHIGRPQPLETFAPGG